MRSIETSGLRAWLTFLLVFFLLAAGIVAISTYYYRNYAQHYRAEVERQLSIIADLKVNELLQWRKERLRDGAVFFKNPSFVALVRCFFEKPEDADAQRQIQDWLGKYQAHDDYNQIRLMDSQGVTRLSVPAGRPPASSTVLQRIPEILRVGQVTFLDFYRHEHDQHIYLAVLVPILDEADASRPLGVLVLRINPESNLYPFIKLWPTTSLTAETLFVRREGNDAVFLNELRFQTNTALNLRVPLDRVAMPAVQSALGQEGIMKGMDYRGVPVVAALRTIPDSPWSLVARMDTAEVYAPMRERLWQIIVLVGVLLFGTGAYVGLVLRRQSVRFYKEWAETENRTRSFATVVRDSNDAITIQDFEGRITAWNRGAELMYGYSEAEALLTNIDRLTTPGKVAEQKDFIRRLVAGENVTSFETQRVAKDGRVLDVWMTVTKLMDDAGKPIGLASTERDITARKREAEEASRMVTVVRDSNDAITIQNFEGRITAWNRGAELMYGYSEAEALLTNIDRLTTPGKVEEQKDFIRRLVAGEAITSFETQRVTKDGRVLDVWMTVTKLMDDAGKPMGLASTERDITARKKAEEALRASEARYRSYVDVTGQIAWVTSTDGEIIEDVPALRKFSGQTYEEAKGSGWAKTIHPDDLEHTLQAWNKAVATKSNYEIEYRMRRHDGVYRHILARGFPVFGEDGSIREWVGTCIDITEFKRTEERIRKLNRVYAMLSNINQAIVRIREPRALFEEACRIAVKDGGFRMAWIGLADPTSGTVLPAAHAGVTDGYLEKLDNIVLGDDARGHGPTGSAARAGKHMVCNDIDNDPRMTPWREDALRNGYHSTAAFPLKVLGEVRGTFGLYAADPGFFDDDEIKLLDELAMDIGFAMEFAEREVERKRAEEALRDSEERYRVFVEGSADGILIADLETKVFKYTNPALCRMLGYTDEELRTMGIPDIHPKDALQSVVAEFEAQARGEKILAKDIPCLRQDGTIIYVDISAATITINHKTCVVGFFRDITERKRAETEIAKQLDELRRWQTVTLGREGRILEMKKEVNELLVRLGEKPWYGSVEAK